MLCPRRGTWPQQRVRVRALLRRRHPSFPDKLDRLDFELSAELPSLHDLPPAL
jgi:hypothetical protein